MEKWKGWRSDEEGEDDEWREIRQNQLLRLCFTKILPLVMVRFDEWRAKLKA